MENTDFRKVCIICECVFLFCSHLMNEYSNENNMKKKKALVIISPSTYTNIYTADFSTTWNVSAIVGWFVYFSGCFHFILWQKIYNLLKINKLTDKYIQAHSTDRSEAFRSSFSSVPSFSGCD